MSKFFEIVGYVASVLAAAFGIIYLINKLTGRSVDEEIEAEMEDACDDEVVCEVVEDDATAEAAE